MLSLISDEIVLPQKKKEDSELSRMTIRYVDYSSIFDSKSLRSYYLSDIEQDIKIQKLLTIDHLFPLKYKPTFKIGDKKSIGAQLINFIDECQSAKHNPHLESDPISTEIETIPRLSIGTIKEFLLKSPYSLIIVNSTHCPGCVEVDSCLPELSLELSVAGI